MIQHKSIPVVEVRRGLRQPTLGLLPQAEKDFVQKLADQVKEGSSASIQVIVGKESLPDKVITTGALWWKKEHVTHSTRMEVADLPLQLESDAEWNPLAIYVVPTEQHLAKVLESRGAILTPDHLWEDRTFWRQGSQWNETGDLMQFKTECYRGNVLQVVEHHEALTRGRDDYREKVDELAATAFSLQRQFLERQLEQLSQKRAAAEALKHILGDAIKGMGPGRGRQDGPRMDMRGFRVHEDDLRWFGL